MRAIFEADSTFMIKGRGIVLAGWVLEGKIICGMRLSIPEFNQILTIQAIDHMSVDPEAGLRPGVIGLRFQMISDEDTQLWMSLNVKGQIYEIDDAES